jgi:hypothetical protein
MRAVPEQGPLRAGHCAVVLEIAIRQAASQNCGIGVPGRAGVEHETRLTTTNPKHEWSTIVSSTGWSMYPRVKRKRSWSIYGDVR